MSLEKSINCLILILVIKITSISQETDWQKLIPLKSKRMEVEKILGQPMAYHQTFGIYQTTVGEFAVSYATGGCRKDLEGRQWKVSPNIMTVLVFSPMQAIPAEQLIKNKEDFVKEEGPYNRFYYTSLDESVIYETIILGDNSEYIHNISLEPGKTKRHLLCKTMK